MRIDVMICCAGKDNFIQTNNCINNIVDARLGFILLNFINLVYQESS